MNQQAAHQLRIPAGLGRAWLGEVSDPEIPVISVVDLGIVRAVELADGDDACTVTITPTYSGCPAMQVIADAVTEALHAAWRKQGALVQPALARLDHRLDERGRQGGKLKGYGIAPPRSR